MPGLFGRIDTVILRVKNIKKAARWYKEVLELTPLYEGENDHGMVIFQVGDGPPLTLYEIGYDEVIPAKRFSSTYPIFYVSDIEAVHSTLTERGVEAESIEDDGAVKYFRFRDPDGNALEVSHYTIP
jgi:catechol 2,3-dioxygenase-like lactoylglutathione lyase family enzyme